MNLFSFLTFYDHFNQWLPRNISTKSVIVYHFWSENSLFLVIEIRYKSGICVNKVI